VRSVLSIFSATKYYFFRFNFFVSGISSNLESDKPDFGDLNLPSKSSFKSVKSDYVDINTPKKTFSTSKSEYMDINYPAKSSRQPISTQHQYTESAESPHDTTRPSSYDEPAGGSYPSPESEIFKEAFKLISQHGNNANADSGERDEPHQQQPEFPFPLPKSHPHPPHHAPYDKVKSHPSIPSPDDGYGNAEFEQPNSVSHHAPNREPANRDPHQRKAYIAPVFDVPHSGEVTFNRQHAPVKYSLHGPHHFGYAGPTSPPSAEYGQRVTHDYPVDSVQYSGEAGGKDHQEYSTHYKTDYHHKPQKSKYEKGGGESFKEHHFSKHGEKGDKGYKKHHDFDEGEMGHHGKEGKKGYFDNESGHKKEHHSEGKKHGEVHGQLHGEKGVKYGEAEGHKKGHKTSGYHNVFHKDEFKKEHKFYDDAHKHGYKDKHGGYHTDHGKKHDHESNGGFHDAAFDQGHKGDSGTYKKGHFDQDHKGHKGASGHESHYNHHEDYGKKGGHSDKKKYGFEHGH
jgi:hypothetical protein